MPRLMKRATCLVPAEDIGLHERQEFTNRVPAKVLFAQAVGILSSREAISPIHEEILFKALERCSAVGKPGETRRPDESRSLEGLDDLRRNIIARLVEYHIPLVHAMCRRYRVAGADADEMISEGSWTLYRAVKGFDVWRGHRFSTYACRSILYSFLSLAKKRRREREVLEKLLRDRPTVTHSSDLEVDVDGPMLMDKVNVALFDKSAGFTDMECCVIEQRFLACSQKRSPTLESIGRVFQLSKERIRQIQCGALAKLRTALAPLDMLGAREEFVCVDRNTSALTTGVYRFSSHELTSSGVRDSA